VTKYGICDSLSGLATSDLAVDGAWRAEQTGLGRKSIRCYQARVTHLEL
jgi:hypothetical protein